MADIMASLEREVNVAHGGREAHNDKTKDAWVEIQNSHRKDRNWKRGGNVRARPCCLRTQGSREKQMMKM